MTATKRPFADRGKMMPLFHIFLVVFVKLVADRESFDGD
jgi:hypothetical protein